MSLRLRAPTLTGEQVSLRAWRLDDAPALERACGDEAICRFTTVPRVYTPAAARDWIELQHDRLVQGTAVVLATQHAGDPRPVGMVGLFGLDRPDRSARLGYWVIDTARRLGLASEAARLLAGWGFRELRLDAVHIDMEPSNDGSRRIAQSLGAGFVETFDRQLAVERVPLNRYTVKAVLAH